MKKRIISILLATAMLLSMTSCGKKNTTYASMSLEEYIENVELPENLTISIDPETVEEREKVKVYENIKLMDFDIDVLTEKMLRIPEAEVITKKETQYVSETDTQQEVINVVAWQGIDFGFNYSWTPNKESTSPAEQFVGGSFPQMYYFGNGLEIDFLHGLFNSADKTLDFASREEVLEKTRSIFADLGIPSIEVKEIVAYDLDVLKGRYESFKIWHEADYAALLAENPELLAEYGMTEECFVSKPQKSDECYVALCRQIIDGIPVNTYTVNGGNLASIDLRYTQNGVERIFANGLLEEPLPSDGTATEIINAVSALELVKEYYGKAILSKEYNVEEMELTYIEYPSEDFTTVELKPYWLVQVGYQQEYSSIDENQKPVEGEIRAYDFLYFDAITGEYFERSPSGKPF